MQGKVLDGKYEILRLVGEGGMGTVYEARHTLIDRRLAVKLLHPHLAASEDLLIRFQQEARIAASIGHENIVEVTDMGSTADGTPYIVMEYLDGQNLLQLLGKERSLAPNRAARIMVQALSALQAAHEAGIVHRDLKAENIYLVNRRGVSDFVKLLDFGIAKLAAPDGRGVSGLTHTGMVLGTPHYMSPEQASGARDISYKSDIYSMGVILFQMVTGTLPFDAGNYNALMVKILTAPWPDPTTLNPQLPPEMAEAIKIAMARRLDARFETCAEFRARLLPFATETESIPAPTVRAGSTVPERASATGVFPTREAVSEYDAIFVGLWHSDGDIALQDGTPLRVLSLDDTQKLSEELERGIPPLVVANATIDLEGLRQRFPDFRSPTILVDVSDTNNELSVHEWDQTSQTFAVCRAPLAQLDDEINRLCVGRRREGGRHEDVSDIGFSSVVRRRDRTFQVETQVVPGSVLRVQSKIWSGGVVVAEVGQELEPGDEAVVEHLTVVAELLHNLAVEQTRQGKHG